MTRPPRSPTLSILPVLSNAIAESKSYFVIAVGSGSPSDSIETKFNGSIISIEPPLFEAAELCNSISIGLVFGLMKDCGAGDGEEEVAAEIISMSAIVEDVL